MESSNLLLQSYIVQSALRASLVGYALRAHYIGMCAASWLATDWYKADRCQVNAADLRAQPVTLQVSSCCAT